MTNSSSMHDPYVFGNATQEWRDVEHNAKILFALSPVYLSVENLTTPNLRVRNLKTGSYLKKRLQLLLN